MCKNIRFVCQIIQVKYAKLNWAQEGENDCLPNSSVCINVLYSVRRLLHFISSYYIYFMLHNCF